MTPGAPHHKGRWRLRGFLLGMDIKGVAAIEAAVALPVYLGLMFGVVDMGLVMFKQITLDRATLQASRCAAVRQSSCLTTAGIQNYAALQAKQINLTAATFNVTTATCGTQVSAQITHTMLFAFGRLRNMTIKSSACMLRTDVVPS